MFGKKKRKSEYEEFVEDDRDEFDLDYDDDDDDFETDFVSLDDDDDERLRKKKGGIGKKIGITFGVIVLVLVVAYISTVILCSIQRLMVIISL